MQSFLLGDLTYNKTHPLGKFSEQFSRKLGTKPIIWVFCFFLVKKGNLRKNKNSNFLKKTGSIAVLRIPFYIIILNFKKKSNERFLRKSGYEPTGGWMDRQTDNGGHSIRPRNFFQWSKNYGNEVLAK